MSRPRSTRTQAPPLTFKTMVSKIALAFVTIYIVYWLANLALFVSVRSKVAGCGATMPKGKAATEAEGRARAEAFFACVEGKLNFIERLFYERTDVTPEAAS
jgi:hypothetical protein